MPAYQQELLPELKRQASSSASALKSFKWTKTFRSENERLNQERLATSCEGERFFIKAIKAVNTINTLVNMIIMKYGLTRGLWKISQNPCFISQKDCILETAASDIWLHHDFHDTSKQGWVVAYISDWEPREHSSFKDLIDDLVLTKAFNPCCAFANV